MKKRNFIRIAKTLAKILFPLAIIPFIYKAEKHGFLPYWLTCSKLGRESHHLRQKKKDFAKYIDNYSKQ